MLRWIGRAPRLVGSLGLSVFAAGLLVGLAGFAMTGCGEEATDVQPEKVDFAKKGADSMKAYMQQKGENKPERH